MKTTFLFRNYAEANPDLAELYGNEDEAALREHYEKYGSVERRGVNLEDYLRVEKVLLSEEGHICIAGWADRRMAESIAVTLVVGYTMYEFGELRDQFCWYHRQDVAEVIGDFERPSGYLFLAQIPDFRMHSEVMVLVNGKKYYSSEAMRWMSVQSFMTDALATCAVLADRPVGATLPLTEKLAPGFSQVWTSYLDRLGFSCLYETGTDREVDRSIIITLYRDTSMLISQLETLAPALSGQPVELIVVANEYTGETALLAEQLAAFSQLHDVCLSMHLCSGNSGFSAGNNYGAKIARGETLIFMNPDIFPPEGQEDQAFAFLAGDPGEGLDGALLYYGDGSLMHSGMYTTADQAVDARMGFSQPVLRVEHYGKGLTAHVDDTEAELAEELREVPEDGLLVTAALWRIRKSVFEEVGGLSTDYIIAYYEDADFCLKMLEAGRPVRLDHSRWIHMEGVGKPKPPMLRTVMWLNRALYSRRFADSPFLAPAATDLFQL
ncbi:MAG: hypothetical protein CML68_20515 [Rhodobacteraceae bacterium]|nr:hypothetical protein [Paracoccaceae bacterium]